MSKVTRVDIPAVNGTLTDLHTLTGEFETAVANLKWIATSLHGCWGDDDGGRSFAEGYLQLADDTLHNSDLTAEDLAGMESILREIVRLYEHLDASAGGVLELVDP